VSGWHAHAGTIDRLFVSVGQVRVVRFDNRPASPTRGLVNEFRFGSVRAGLICVPPRVWHGIQNMHHEPSVVLNLVDRAYSYERPDHWRVPHNTPHIPYRFPTL
jgi:dTDP-4-dehydrorhamnose 3,5-epimerase